MSERADFFFLPEHLGMGETRYGRSSVVLAPIPKKGLEGGREGGKGEATAEEDLHSIVFPRCVKARIS